MRKIYYVLLIITSTLLFGCKESGHQQNGYSQIQPGMTYAQVVKILDKPTQIDKISVDGMPATSASWHKKNGVIVIEFLNDKVEIKTINNIGSVDVDNS